MAFKNQLVMPARQPGTAAKNDSKPDANMPANNVGTFPVKFGSGPSNLPMRNPSGAAQGGSVAKATTKADMPAKNKITTPLPLGTIKHSVGQVPHYLRGQSK